MTRPVCCRGWLAPPLVPAATRAMAAHSKASGDPLALLPSRSYPPSSLGLPTFSLGAFTARQDTSSILVPMHDRLSAMDPRNDSQTLFTDQLIPGSVLLGYLNADHWAVGLPLDQARPVLAALFTHPERVPSPCDAGGGHAHRRRDVAGSPTMTSAAPLILTLGLLACAAPRPFEPYPAGHRRRGQSDTWSAAKAARIA